MKKGRLYAGAAHEVEEKESLIYHITGGEMRQEKYRLGQDITVVVPRDLWWRVKYEALLRQIPAKALIIEALETALARWEAKTNAKIQKRG